MFLNEQDRIQYEERVKAQRDELWKRNMAVRDLEKASREALQKGLQEGRQEGQKQEREASLKRLKLIRQINERESELGQTVSHFDELFELTEEVLQKRLFDLGETTR